MKRILIRTLGGRGIGYGHYYRCLSLAKAIWRLNNNIEIIFIANDDLRKLIATTGFKFIISNDLNKDFEIIGKLLMDLFIFDSYLGNNDYLKEIKLKSKLMLIDDNNDIYDSTIPDIIYNGNIHASRLGYTEKEGQLRLLGARYLIMKEEYWMQEYKKDVVKKGILITTGGTDEYGVSLKIVQQIKDLDFEIKVVIGPGYEDEYTKKIESLRQENIKLIYQPTSLKQYIDCSAIVITAGGSTVYEVLSQNSIPIVFSIADNQDMICNELGDEGIDYIGKYPDINYLSLPKAIKDCQHKGLTHSKRLELVNGRGALLVAEIIISN